MSELLSDHSKTLLAAKKNKGLSFEKIGELVNQNEVWVAALFYQQATASLDQAQTLVRALDLPESFITTLTSYPVKGLGPVVPTDPLIYRFYEIMQVYGFPMKDIIQEKFGDGIMSAIDFTLDIDKVEDPKGDRVKVTMNGKFLPYKKW
jgi:cyanate lyase